MYVFRCPIRFRCIYWQLLRSKKYPASNTGRMKSPKDWSTWKYWSNLIETGLSKSEREDIISFKPTPNKGPASNNPTKNVNAKQAMVSSNENRSLVKGVRLPRIGVFGRSTDFV